MGEVIFKKNTWVWCFTVCNVGVLVITPPIIVTIERMFRDFYYVCKN